MKLTVDQLQGIVVELNLPLLQSHVEALHAAMVAREKETPGVREFIARWCDLWSEKYQDKPPVNGRAAATAKRIVKDLGLPRSLELLERYFLMGDAWFAQRRHDLATLENNLTAVASGKTVTRTQIQQVERRSNTQTQLERIKRGDL